MTIRLIQVGLLDPTRGHNELDAAEREGFEHRSTVVAADGKLAVVTMVRAGGWHYPPNTSAHGTQIATTVPTTAATAATTATTAPVPSAEPTLNRNVIERDGILGSGAQFSVDGAAFARLVKGGFVLPTERIGGNPKAPTLAALGSFCESYPTAIVAGTQNPPSEIPLRSNVRVDAVSLDASALAEILRFAARNDFSAFERSAVVFDADSSLVFSASWR